MLDLDALAEQCAVRLNQTKENWTTVIWSTEFQKFSANMSDGEVENLIIWCPTSQHLKSAVQFLGSRATAAGQTPFSVLIDEARGQSVSPEEWIKKFLPLA